MKKVNEIEMEMEDLDIEGLEVEEVDPIEAEIAAVEEKKGKKAKKEKAPKGEKLSSTKALAEDEVGASYIAEVLGIDQRTLRGFLRANYRNMETEKSQRYVWKKGDPQIQEIVDAFKAKAAAPKKTKTDKAMDKAEVVEAQIEEVDEINLEDIEEI